LLELAFTEGDSIQVNCDDGNLVFLKSSSSPPPEEPELDEVPADVKKPSPAKT
jgi:hypothetical protein